MSHWTFASSPLLICMALAMGLAALFFSRRIWIANARSRQVLFLEVLRTGLILMLLITLLRPERIQVVEWSEEPAVVVLSDGSGSMHTRDVILTNQVVARREWIRHQLESSLLEPLKTTSRLLVDTFAEPPSSENPATDKTSMEGTDLNQALESVLQAESNLKAVLLLSDGDWNLGSTPALAAARYRNQSVPVFAVQVGRTSPLPDIELSSINAPAYGLMGEQISIPFHAHNRMQKDISMVAILKDGEEIVAQKTIVLPAASDLQETIVWSPQKVGERSLSLELPIQDGEALEDNNLSNFSINVRMETLKVLVVDSYPRWEYRYLRNALERDPGVEMKSLLFHPQVGMGGGRHYLERFPDSKDLIAPYDVLFLGDVGVGENGLTQDNTSLIRGLVEQQAGGLVLMPGRRGKHLSWLGTPLEHMIPVQFDLKRPEGIGLQNEAQLALTRLGSGHWLTRFDMSAERNTELWRQLPGFYWSTAVEKGRPGSEVLAVHDSIRNNWGRIPLLAIRPFGSGKVLFMGSDSAWRWRRGVEDLYHYRFWSQIVRWMAHQRHISGNEGVRLTYTPEKPEMGQTVYLSATIMDRSGYPLQEGRVMASVTTPGGGKETLEMQPEDGGWGVFRATIEAREAGMHLLKIRSSEEGRELETRLEILRPMVEKVGQPAREDVLKEIARVSRGKQVDTSGLEELVEQISVLPEPKPIEIRLRLWSHPVWGGLLLAMMSIYWVGRKYFGLV
ncbi:MAG: hypothetical protein P8L18_11805 [Verrucomicrobiota bacterium]|nr:hypothetical protein [Verrucomicrobiota bacterium]